MPFQFTVEEETKFVPVTVKVIAGLPITPTAGSIEVRVGTGASTEKVTPPDVPPPGDGFVTVMVEVPAASRSDAGTCAEREVPLVYEVVSAVPFQFTVEEEIKFVPVTARAIAELPAAAEEGATAASVGAGFGGTLIVNVTPEDVPPPGVGLATVTVAVPTVAKSEAGTCAERELELV